MNGVSGMGEIRGRAEGRRTGPPLSAARTALLSAMEATSTLGCTEWLS